MKKSYFVLALVFVLMLSLSVSSVSAQFSSLTTGYQVQNLSAANAATITMTFYKADGTVDATVNDTIAAGSSNNYASLTTAQFSDVETGFDGAVVISSDQEVAAIINILGDGGAFGGASYGSFSQGGTTVSLPLVARNFFNINTFFYVQNTGSSPADVTVTYQPGGTTENATIPVGSSHKFDQQTSSVLSDGYLGAATIVSNNNEPLVAVGVQHDPDSLLAYNGFTGGSTNPVMPLVVNNIFATDTGIQIQNTGNAATTVEVTYQPSPGNPGGTCTESKSIDPGASANYGIAYLTNTPACNGASGFIGSAAVTSNSASQPLVALVNQVTIGGANGSAYSAFDPAQGTATVNVPLVIYSLPIAGGATLFTGMNVVNVGTQDTTVTCTFAGQSAAANASGTIKPGEALNAAQTAGVVPAGTVTSAVCTASGGDAKIVGVVNQVGGFGDTVLTYEAINQ